MFANNKDVNKFKKAMNSIGSCLAPIDTKGELTSHFYGLLAHLVYYKNNEGSLFTEVSDKEEIKKIVDDGTLDIRNFINDAAEIFQTPHIKGGVTTEKLRINEKAYTPDGEYWYTRYTVSYEITKLSSYAYAAYKVSRQRACIEKNGSHLSDTGALNLFKRELNQAMNWYGINPDVSLYDILRLTINASHGDIL